MRVPITTAGAPSSARAPQASPKSDLASFIATHRVDLKRYEAMRKHLHADPELSELESSTGEYIASYLIDKLGWAAADVHTKIGGYGVAAVLRNGPGPTVLLRSDTDALPVKEQSGLPYASTKTMRDTDGKSQPVMHACGHDVHMTCLLAAAETLIKTRAHWSGTLELVFQPAEERLVGAAAMVAAGLYGRYIPEPDVLLGQHVFPQVTGTVHTRAGPLLAASDSFKITFYGRGSHASQPQDSVDPVVMATAAVQRLQGIVAREVSPLESAVVTVAAIHAGEAENVIVDEAFIRVNVRTFKKEVRETVLAAIKRVVTHEARASGAPKDPLVEVTHAGPATVNDGEVHARVAEVFTKVFGKKRFDPDTSVVMGSEDFGNLAAPIGKPSCFWFFGGSDPDLFGDDGKPKGPLPANHSPFFAPVMQPTLQTGVDALVAAAMAYLGKDD